MSDPVGGREAEIEAVAKALVRAAAPHGILAPRRSAEAAIAALDALRSSGSAAQPGIPLGEGGHVQADEAESGSAAQNQEDVQKAWDEGRHPFGPGSGQAVTQPHYEAARSPQDEDHCPTCDETGPDIADPAGTYGGLTELRCGDDWHYDKVRSPQDEDHEDEDHEERPPQD